MAAIITDGFKKHVAELLLEQILDVADSDQYYIGIGKADQYDSTDTVPLDDVGPLRTLREERIARANLQSIKRVTSEDVSLVVRRYNWTSGNIYPAFNDFTVGHTNPSYYVITDANEVYICLFQPKDANGLSTVRSTVKPSFTTAAVSKEQAFTTADGYTWKLAFGISAVRANNFLSSNYIPVRFLEDSASVYAGLARDQVDIRDAAVKGQVLGVALTNGGSGYSSAPTVTIRGNGTGARATAYLSGSTIAKIEMDSIGAWGSGYEYASISITGGGSPTVAAAARPIIGPIKGIGYNPLDDLKATDLMVRVKTDSSEGGTFLINDQDFRQIVLLKNPEYKSGTIGGTTDSDLFDGIAAKVLRAIQVDDVANLNQDDLIVGDSASAYINQISGKTIFYHQNENTGFGKFANGESVTIGAYTKTVTVSTDSSGTGAVVDAFSGDVLYIENRARVQRAAGQSEDIKIVLSF